MKDNINYLRLAMDSSDGMFAWHLFGVCNAVHGGGHVLKESPDEHAREYLAIFHSEALTQAENNSEKTLDASV